MRKWKREGVNGDKYREEKRSYKKLYKDKKKKELNGWEKEVGDAKLESQVWKIVNKEEKD